MDKILKSIQQLLKISAETTWSPLSDIKKFYYWDPFIIPNSSLPCIAIQPITTEYLMRGSRYDQKTHTIEIRVIMNMLTYLSTQDNKDIEINKTVYESIIMAENTDSNQHTEDNTICWIIQNNSKLPYTIDWDTINTCELASISNINYTFNDQRQEPTFEIIITVKVLAIWDRQ